MLTTLIIFYPGLELRFTVKAQHVQNREFNAQHPLPPKILFHWTAIGVLPPDFFSLDEIFSYMKSLSYSGLFVSITTQAFPCISVIFHRNWYHFVWKSPSSCNYFPTVDSKSSAIINKDRMNLERVTPLSNSLRISLGASGVRLLG